MNVRILLYVLLGGLPLSLAAMGGGHALPFYLAGVLLTACLLPVALFGPRTFLGQLSVITPFLWVVNSFCLWTEGLIFLPAMRTSAAQTLLAMLVINFIQAVTLAGLSLLLRSYRSQVHTPVALHSMLGALLRVLACAFAYATYYLAFGFLTYRYFTRPFYPEAYQQVAAVGVWFRPIQIARGLLMTLAVWPVIATLRLSRRETALVVAVMVWIAGGLAPLLLPNPYFGAAQRVYHILEILTQNASLGITAVLLLRRPATHSTPASTLAPAGSNPSSQSDSSPAR